MIVLVINCGSSSIKYQIFRQPAATVLASGLIECIGADNSRLIHKKNGEEHTINFYIPDHEAGMKKLLEILTDPTVGVIQNITDIKAVGHRVVHGGEAYSKPVVIIDEVLKAIEACADLAPLHNPPNLVGINASSTALPGVPQVAVFDTAFHQSIPKEAYLYALPYEYYTKYQIRRYGFHGTSHHYVTRKAADVLGKKESEINIITCHLGNGGSITAVKNGKSVDTSMGLTPLEGIVMGTRSGDIDPSIPWFLTQKGMTPDEINNVLNKKSGLMGISGISNDMRNLLEAADNGNSQARLAVDIFNYRIKKYVGSYMAVLGKVDAILFTGGIGENNSYIRASVLENMQALGVELDEEKNAVRSREARDVATDASSVRVLVIPTDEEGYIASETYRMVAGD